MKQVLKAIMTVISLVSCSKDYNLAEQIAAQGIYDSANALDKQWIGDHEAETIRLQSDKIITIPISQNLWNISKSEWNVLNADARGMIYLYVSKKKDGNFYSACTLESYLILDTVTSGNLSISGKNIKDTKELKDITTFRLPLISRTLVSDPRASDLLRVCQHAYSLSLQEQIAKYYQNLLTSAWLEEKPTYCKTDAGCASWRNQFPSHWGPGEPLCKAEEKSGISRCQMQAEYGQSCSLYLTKRGLSKMADDYGSFLVSSNRQLELSCTKPGYACLPINSHPSGLFSTSCRPEMERPTTLVGRPGANR